jgi:hypothetical protein
MAQNIIELIRRDHGEVMQGLNTMLRRQDVPGRVGREPTIGTGGTVMSPGGTMVSAAESLLGVEGRLAGGPEQQQFLLIAGALREHMAGEEAVFYPELALEIGDTIDEARRDHDDIRRRISVIEDIRGGAQMDDIRWLNLANELGDVIRLHIEAEETGILPRAREIFGDQELEEMGQRFLEEKQRSSGGRARATGAEASV